MFTIYNELQKPIELISNLKTDKMVILKKVPIRENGRSIDIKMSKKLIFKTPIDLVNLNKKLLRATNTKEPVVVIDVPLSTIFNRADFTPFILCTKGVTEKAIGLITLDLNNKNIVGINDTQCFIFENLCTRNELSLFVSINDETKPLVITLYDRTIDKVIKYIFTNVNGAISLKNETMIVADRRLLNIKLRKRYEIPKFRPAKPTYTILGLPDVEIPTIIKRELYNYVPVSLVGDDFVKELNNLVVNKYSAVTIYIEGMTDTQIQKAIEKAKQFMMLVYTMDSTGKVRRHKLQ